MLVNALMIPRLGKNQRSYRHHGSQPNRCHYPAIIGFAFIVATLVECAPRQSDVTDAAPKPEGYTHFLGERRRTSTKPNGLQYTISHVDMAENVGGRAVVWQPPNFQQADSSSLRKEDGSPFVVKPADFFRAFEKSGIMQSIMRLVSSATSSTSSGSGARDTVNDYRRARDESARPLSGVELSQRQYDAPIMPASIAADGKQMVELSSSIDAVPESVSEAPLSIFASAGDEWKRTLFGPSGILTGIFSMINQKRKEDARVAAAAAKTVAADGRQSDAAAPLAADFSKIIDAFLSKTQSGNFDEPLPEIPFLGICDRLSCGDIYKAFDEFRKSEMFSNFQTAVSLLHDQKGWDIIGEVLANPELIENFTGGGGDVDNGTKSARKSLKALTSKLENVGEENGKDGDFGVDFSTLVDELSTKSERTMKKDGEPTMPEIAESVDYYSSVDGGGEETLGRSVPVEEKLVRTNTHTSSQSLIDKTHNKTVSPAGNAHEVMISSIKMPEIMESIDELPEEAEGVAVAVEERVPIVAGNQSAGKISNESNQSYGLSSAFRRIFTTNETNSAVTIKPQTLATNGSVMNLKTTTRLPMRTTTPPVARLTTKNFRRDNDYYSMYYDDQG